MRRAFGRAEDAHQKQNFYWRVIVGAWEHNIGGGTPRDFGLCGDLLDENITLICKRPEHDFPYLERHSTSQ